MCPKGPHRGPRELHPAVLAVLARLDPPAAFGPRARDVHALTTPVDVLAGERGRLAPPQAPTEADHEECHPARLERLAGLCGIGSVGSAPGGPLEGRCLRMDPGAP